MSAWKSSHGEYFLPLYVLVVVAAFYALIASVLVAYVEPIAGGMSMVVLLLVLAHLFASNLVCLRVASCSTHASDIANFAAFRVRI